jgi:hypothetical protein
LYPSQWRDEYGTELEDLLLAEPLQTAVVLNVIANALRQQVRISNHPPSVVRFLTFVLRVSFAFGAFLCGVRAMGYWVILQVGGLPPAENGGIALVVYSSVFWFVILSSASASVDLVLDIDLKLHAQPSGAGEVLVLWQAPIGH